MNIVIISGKFANIFDNITNVRFTIAEKYKDKTQFITITAFGNNAEFIKKYVKKGDHISVEGRIDVYTNNFGKETLSLVANTINFEGYQKPKETKTEHQTPPIQGEVMTEIENTESWEEIVSLTNSILSE